MPGYRKYSRHKTTKKRAEPEHELQVAFFQWLTLQYPAVRKVSFAVPNGVRCSFSQAKKLVAEGLTKGALDVILAIPNSTFHALFIEFKIKPNKPTLEQEAMISNLSVNGYKCEVCYNLEEAINAVNNYVKCTTI